MKRAQSDRWSKITCKIIVREKNSTFLVVYFYHLSNYYCESHTGAFDKALALEKWLSVCPRVSSVCVCVCKFVFRVNYCVCELTGRLREQFFSFFSSSVASDCTQIDGCSEENVLLESIQTRRGLLLLQERTSAPLRSVTVARYAISFLWQIMRPVARYWNVFFYWQIMWCVKIAIKICSWCSWFIR